MTRPKVWINPRWRELLPLVFAGQPLPPVPDPDRRGGDKAVAR